MWFDYKMQFVSAYEAPAVWEGPQLQLLEPLCKPVGFQEGKKGKGFKRWVLSKELHIQHLTEMIQMLLNFLQLLGFMTYLGLCPPED